MSQQEILATTHGDVRDRLNDNFDELYAKTSFESLSVGSASDLVTISASGTFRYEGDTTVWKDMIMDVFGKRLSSTAGKVDYDYEENCLTFSPNGSIDNQNDRVGGNQEINHEFKIGTAITFNPHIHWWQEWASASTLPVEFTARWRLQHNGSLKSASWTEISGTSGSATYDVYDFSSASDGTYNQITRLDDITVDCGLSDTLQIQFTRTDSESGDVSVYFFDLHGEVDSDGSDTELSKA